MTDVCNYGYGASVALRRDDELSTSLSKLKLAKSQTATQMKQNRHRAKEEAKLLAEQKAYINGGRGVRKRGDVSDGSTSSNECHMSHPTYCKSTTHLPGVMNYGGTPQNGRLPTTSQKSICDNPSSASIITAMVFQRNYCDKDSPSPFSTPNSAPPKMTRRRIQFNSIKHSARRKNGTIGFDKRPRTAAEASVAGRSLRTLHQITHIEAIAASNIQRKRDEWLANREQRKLKESRVLQKKVDNFIEKIENDKRIFRERSNLSSPIEIVTKS